MLENMLAWLHFISFNGMAMDFCNNVLTTNHLLGGLPRIVDEERYFDTGTSSRIHNDTYWKLTTANRSLLQLSILNQYHIIVSWHYQRNYWYSFEDHSDLCRIRDYWRWSTSLQTYHTYTISKVFHCTSKLRATYSLKYLVDNSRRCNYDLKWLSYRRSSSSIVDVIDTQFSIRN